MGVDGREEPRPTRTPSTSPTWSSPTPSTPCRRRPCRRFADHGEVTGDEVTGRGAEAQAVFDQLAAVGIDIDDVFKVLETEGVDKFKVSWAELVDTVKAQMAAVAGPAQA